MNNPPRFDNTREILYVIPKEDILLFNFSKIKEFVEFISDNQASHLKNVPKIQIAVDGYNDDPRELYEIPEVRLWFLESLLYAQIPWFYLLKEVEQLRILLFAFCDIQVGRQVTPSKTEVSVQINSVSQAQVWFEINRDNLEQFIRRKKLPREIRLTALEPVKEMGKLLDLPLISPVSPRSKRKPDLGEYLSKHPQVKRRLLKHPIHSIIGKYIFTALAEGIGVTLMITFPRVGRTAENLYYLTLCFPPETEVDLLKAVLDKGYLSFQIIDLCQSYQSSPEDKYRPISAVWIPSEPPSNQPKKRGPISVAWILPEPNE